MKFITLISFLFLGITSLAQSSKDTLNCTAIIKIEDSIKDDTLRISRFKFEGLTVRRANIWRKKLNFYQGISYVINDDTFLKMLSSICNPKKPMLIEFRAISDEEILKDSFYLIISKKD